MDKDDKTASTLGTIAALIMVPAAAIWMKYGWNWGSVLALVVLALISAGLFCKIKDDKRARIFIWIAIIFAFLAEINFIIQIIIYGIQKIKGG